MTHVIIVLGQALLQGSIPQVSLLSRVLMALSLIRQSTGGCQTLLLSGGVNAAFPTSMISEAQVMEKLVHSYYGEKSIESNMMLESKSQNTIENAINCYEFVHSKPHSVSKCSIVTSEFHIPRTRCIFDTVFSTMTDRMHYVPSDSYLNKTQYRAELSLRPKNIDLWSLPERLDIELLAIDKLPEDMKKYGLSVSHERITRARKEILALRRSRGVSPISTHDTSR